jgi:excinuclease ABC subunit B
MYANSLTDAMNKAIDETNRRREKQVAYNTLHGIDPTPLRKKIADITDDIMREEEDTAKLLENSQQGRAKSSKIKPGQSKAAALKAKGGSGKGYQELVDLIVELDAQMKAAATELHFELAARIRDELVEIKRELRMLEQHNS